jgi:uncharacterized membrane protein (UPF0127 family)
MTFQVAVSTRAARWAALFVAMAWLGAFLCPPTADARMRKDTLTLVTKKGERVITIEVAESEQQKALGLMYRTSLADDAGMLFPYDRPQELTMWMKNTYIPLDMVFIRADGIVHRIEARTEPFSERTISSNGPVTAVLELAGGAAARIGLEPGDRVVYSHFRSVR